MRLCRVLDEAARSSSRGKARRSLLASAYNSELEIYGAYTPGTYSLDGNKAQLVVDEIKAAGGDAIAVGGDVGAEDFPERIVKATVE